MSRHKLYQEPKPQFEDGLWVLYDLRCPEGRELARRTQAAWGKYRTNIYACGANHVVLSLRPGGAQEVAR